MAPPSQQATGTAPRTAGGVYVALLIGIQMTGNINRFFDHPIVLRPRRLPADALGVVGWGLKRKSLKAVAYAERVGLPYLALEDGFLRSVGLGNTSPPLSLIVDDVGVYFDANRPSRLERLIAAPHTDAQRVRGARLAEGWRAGRLSKYNHAREKQPPVDGPFVLAVDQTFGDASIEYGMANAASFTRMLEAALDENPGLPVVLKVHPDVIAGRRKGHFNALTPGQASRVVLLSDNAHPPPLFERAHAVYVVTSQMGLEAMAWGKPVRTFGMPFYAGWGLTRDELAAPERRRTAHTVTTEDLVHAALVEYPRYIDPETLARCEPERLVEWMGLQRRMRERLAPQIQAVAFADWKQPVAQAFFGGSQLRFAEKAQPVLPGEALAVWGRAEVPWARGTAMTPAPLLRVEDGFMRSVGLGAHWVPPVSWVVDQRGIYYDATAPSDLEHLLEQGGFHADELTRAAALRQAIVAAGITKYNVGSGHWQRPDADGSPRRHVILVPGQVETDASIAYGAPGLRSNTALLQAVRAARPEAWIVYKPHPDVLAKKRDQAVPGGDGIEAARPWCNEVVIDTPIHRLFEQVDEVQVLTSLAGFEALLRGLPVVCHGSPFYSGWGLTTDLHATPRRTRRLTLDELVAGALLRYPAYVSRVSGAFTTAERALYELQHWAECQPPVDPLHLRLLRRLKRWRDRLRQL